MHDADIRAQLDRERHIIEAATEGPWRKYLRHDGMEHDDGSSSYVGAIYPGVEPGPPPVFLTNGIDKRDATFIAHARTALPVRNAQVEAVLALHSRDAVFTDMCDECSDFGTDDHPPGQHVPYPCPTVRAIEEAGNA